MLFSDLFFLFLFLPLCLIIYNLAPSVRARNFILLLFSLLFYAFGEPVLILLLIVSAFVNYGIALALEKRIGTKAGSVLLGFTLTGNIGLLVVLKYTDFFIDTLNRLFSLSLPMPHFLLPLGISFYTFEIVSYLLDVYWEKIPACRSYSNFLLYVSLFPSITAGPIVRYEQIESELNERPVSVTTISDGVSRILRGLAKKVLIADMLASVVTAFLGTELASQSVAGCWYGILVYSLQMFFDFSGYSDMAIGIAALFGFTFPENFRYPFVSSSIAEFWQRWHITLGSFFRDYLLYVPIFGKQRRFGGLFLVWLCTGLWHGASWNYVIWGLYFGFFLFIETLLGKKKLKKIPTVLRHIVTLLIVVVGFGIFYSTAPGTLPVLFKGLIGLNGAPLWDDMILHSLANNAFLLAAALLFSTPVVPFLAEKLRQRPGGEIVCGMITILFNISALLLCSLILVNATDHPFQYARVF